MDKQIDTFPAVDAITKRRSVKHYDSSHRLTTEEIWKLTSLAALAPTAFNIQHYRFVVVLDPKQRALISDAAHGQPQVAECSALFVIAGDIKAYAKSPSRYWENTPQGVQETLEKVIMDYYEGREQVQRDEAVLSCGMAAATLMIAAKAMGLDSCPMRGFDFDAVARIVNLPPDHCITMLIAVGKAAVPPHDRPTKLPLDEMLIVDKFA